MFTILIDGPSGSGKTTLGRKLAAATGFRLVHLDDFYPGWAGLAAGREMVATQVLDPRCPGFRRWDWERDQPGEWVPLTPGKSLVIEGAGAVSGASISAARRLGGLLTLRVDAPVELRRDRALRRDPGYRPWWEMWAQQEEEHFRGPGRVPVDLELGRRKM